MQWPVHESAVESAQWRLPRPLLGYEAAHSDDFMPSHALKFDHVQLLTCFASIVCVQTRLTTSFVAIWPATVARPYKRPLATERATAKMLTSLFVAALAAAPVIAQKCSLTQKCPEDLPCCSRELARHCGAIHTQPPLKLTLYAQNTAIVALVPSA